MGAGTEGSPITQAGVGQEFRVRVDFTFHNNGHDTVAGQLSVVLGTPPDGCEFLLPANGILSFPTGVAIQPSLPGTAYAALKVRCTTPGSVAFSAKAVAAPVTGVTDNNPDNNETVFVIDKSINIVGGTVEDTPTPTATPTPTPTAGG
jgi:hypothetical protein